MRDAVTPGCGPWFDEVRLQAGWIRADVVAAEEAARQADVCPGTRRDMRGKYQLDFLGLRAVIEGLALL